MNDKTILDHIQNLVAEEDDLRERASTGDLQGDAHARLEALQVELDQYWDLLRQRRARREFGQDPDDAQTRDATTVERYQQ